MEFPNHCGSELTGRSDDQPFGSSSIMMMKEEGRLIVISTGGEDIMPIIENKVKEEIQIALQKFRVDKDWNNDLAITASVEKRSLQLKFLDEVFIPVHTGEKLSGEGGAALRLAVVDKKTGKLAASGPGTSAKVEILILQATENEDDLNWSIEDFNKRIIRGRNEGKPYFSKEMYVNLEEGMVNVCVKLGHGTTWVKACLCRLGARVVDGSMVKEAWTKAFMVRDCRNKYNKKQETPSLSDNICSVRSIWRGGKSYRSMQREKIYTVKDLLIRLLKDYDGLKKIVNLGEKKWEDMVKHARACPSGRRMYCYTNSQRSISVVFNIHGEILRLYPKRRYAAAQMLSQENKDIAGDLFSSAIGHWENVVQFDNESSLQQHLSSLGMSVDRSDDSVESGQPVEPHNIVASEMIGVHSDSSFQGIISNTASTQENHMECIDHRLSTDDVPIMDDLYPETIVSNTTFEDFLSVDTGTEGTGFMLTVPYRNQNGDKILTSDEASTPTSSYSSIYKNTCSPDFMQQIDWMESESFSFTSPATDSLFCDMGSVPPPCWKDNIQFSEMDGAKWGWNVLICLLAMRFSLKRIVVARRTRVEEVSTPCY